MYEMYEKEWIPVKSIVKGDVIRFTENIYGSYKDGYGRRLLGETISTVKVLHDFYEGSKHGFSVMVVESIGVLPYRKGEALTLPGYVIYGHHGRPSERLKWKDEKVRRVVACEKTIRRTSPRFATSRINEEQNVRHVQHTRQST